MKRLLVAALAALALAAAAATSAPAAVPAHQVCVRNYSDTLPDSVVQNALPAIQAAADEDFTPVWGSKINLVFIGRSVVPKGCWVITIRDDVACWGCAGYHETHRGLPRAWVLSDKDWSIILTHELWEMLVDPWVKADGSNGRFVQVGKRYYLEEVADPVEADQYAYVRNGADGTPVEISDFVTPDWFSPGSKGPYDFNGYITRPLYILPGGYISYIGADGAWHQIMK